MSRLINLFLLFTVLVNYYVSGAGLGPGYMVVNKTHKSLLSGPYIDSF